MRQFRTEPPSNGAQLKYFLLYSSVGMTCIFTFGVVMLYSVISGIMQ